MTILVAGNIVVDLFVSGMERLPHVGGDEYVASNVTFFPAKPVLTIGGNAGNAAYALAALGADVAVFGALGDDAFGATARGWLVDRGVDTAALRSSAAATSMTVVATDTALNRVAYHHAGANDEFVLTDLDVAELRRADVLFVTSYPICARLREAGALRDAFASVKARGGVTALDIGPDIGAPLRMAEIVDVLPHVDHLLANQHELAVFTGSDDVSTGAARALAAGVARVIVKGGKHGATLFAPDGAGNGAVASIDVPGFAVDAKFTVGAGDAFAAGYLHGVIQHWPLKRAIRFGNAVAALVVSSGRGVLGCPTLQEAEDLVSNR